MGATPLDDQVVESIERATLEAVVPDRLDELPGWLMPVFDGTVGRARCAVPLSHRMPRLDLVYRVEQVYIGQGYPPAYRLPDLLAFAPLHTDLEQRGFERQQPTLTLHGLVSDLLRVHAGPAGDLTDVPDAQWMAMFLGPGLDPADGASRSRALSRARHTRFASVRDAHGATLACGAAGFGHGWLSVHGMRTALEHRNRGLAGRVLLTMAQEAARRGVARVFLQVDAGNEAALALYRRAGLTLAWPYAYWRRSEADLFRPGAQPGT